MTSMKASQRMFTIFEYMVPKHVIGRMITNPGNPIADPVPRVSILFIMIVDFEEKAQSLAPEELLRFLNQQFSQMDQICAANDVTKVETVGEEYVACVGAVPSDIAFGQANGHAKVAARLFKAADEILKLQTDDVKFQMGMHSGPIVAGVIGSKLPRYRLFGDTINTTARFMQKGQPGRLQMSEEANKDVSPGVEVEYRGQVEMKGKGAVDAWFLKSVALGPRASQTEGTKTRGSTVSAASDQQPSPSKEASKSTSKGAATFSRSRDLLSNLKSGRKGLLGKRRPGGGNAAEEEEEEEEDEGEDNSEFAGILAQMTAGKRDDEAASSLFEELTPEHEDLWFRWFHRGDVCRNLLVRLDRQMFLLALLTFLETCFFSQEKAWEADHNLFPGWLRLPIFQTCRTAAFIVLMFWRAALSSSRFAAEHPAELQIGLVISYCLVALLVFMSYSVMLVTDNSMLLTKVEDGEIFKKPKTDEEKADMRSEQMTALGFVLVFYCITTAETTKFGLSLLFPLTALAIMCGTTSLHAGFGQLYFHNEGRFLFIANAAMVAFIAYEVEQGSRKRFKAKHAVKLTEQRTEGILSTLLPPLVMQELASLPPNAPPPSHSYRAATIAQSDMCGFTQLSSTRKPHEVVAFMSDLFGAFDVLCDEFGIYKVETVGDAYIAGMAEHTLTRKHSAVSVIKFGLAMIDAVHAWAKKLGGDATDVTCRVGVHHGECIGGIVGSGMMRYHIFGKMMTCMEVLESTAPKARVQVSPAAKGAAEYDCGPDGDAKPGGGLTFTRREEDKLFTSKGIKYDAEIVGGRTWIVDM
jgi:class 3 adenylate cyclase